MFVEKASDLSLCWTLAWFWRLVTISDRNWWSWISRKRVLNHIFFKICNVPSNFTTRSSMKGCSFLTSTFVPILVHHGNQMRSFKYHFPKIQAMHCSSCRSGYSWIMLCNPWFNFCHQIVSLLSLKMESQAMNGKNGAHISLDYISPHSPILISGFVMCMDGST